MLQEKTPPAESKAEEKTEEQGSSSNKESPQEGQANASPTPRVGKEAEGVDPVAETREESERFTKDVADQMNAYLGYPLVSALIAVLVFVALGKLVDWIVTGVFARLVTKTRSDLDDKILHLLHRPIFLSVLLIGLGLATYTLYLPNRVTSVTIHILQSIAVFVWFRFGLNLTREVVEEIEESKGGSRFVTPTTKPVIVKRFPLYSSPSPST